MLAQLLVHSSMQGGMHEIMTMPRDDMHLMNRSGAVVLQDSQQLRAQGLPQLLAEQESMLQEPRALELPLHWLVQPSKQLSKSSIVVLHLPCSASNLASHLWVQFKLQLSPQTKSGCCPIEEWSSTKHAAPSKAPLTAGEMDAMVPVS